MIIMRCIAHLTDLCVGTAVKLLPATVIKFCQKAHYTFSKSAHKAHNFKLVQKELTLPHHEILGLSDTRCSALESVSERNVEQWDALWTFDIRNGETELESLMTEETYFFFGPLGSCFADY